MTALTTAADTAPGVTVLAAEVENAAYGRSGLLANSAKEFLSRCISSPQALRRTGHSWLELEKLCGDLLIPRDFLAARLEDSQGLSIHNDYDPRSVYIPGQ